MDQLIALVIVDIILTGILWLMQLFSVMATFHVLNAMEQDMDKQKVYTESIHHGMLTATCSLANLETQISQKGASSNEESKEAR